MYIKHSFLPSIILLGLLSVNSAIAAVNDDFDNATGISFPLPFSDSLNTYSATSAFDDPSPCAPTGKTVWYSITPPVDMTITANTFDSNFDTVLAAYTGSRGNLTELACNDDDYGLQSQISFFAPAHQQIFFMIGGYGGDAGNLVFTLTSDVNTFCPEDDYATYSPMTGILAIPFVDIPLLDPENLQPTGEIGVFEVELRLQGRFPLESDFAIKKLKLLSERFLLPDEACHAVYSYADKTLKIPFVEVPSIDGWPSFEEIDPKSILEIELKYFQESPLKSGTLYVENYTYIDTVGENNSVAILSQKLIDKGKVLSDSKAE